MAAFADTGETMAAGEAGAGRRAESGAPSEGDTRRTRRGGRRREGGGSARSTARGRRRGGEGSGGMPFGAELSWAVETEPLRRSLQQP